MLREGGTPYAKHGLQTKRVIDAIATRDKTVVLHQRGFAASEG